MIRRPPEPTRPDTLFPYTALCRSHAIADTIFAAIGGLDTTHTVTNPRMTAYDGKQATLFALVEAQHLPRGDHARHLLLKHIYTMELSRHGSPWQIRDRKSTRLNSSH